MDRENLLLVVDMVNGFIREGAMADKGIESIIGENVRLCEEFIKNRDLVFFIKDCHGENALEFKKFPKHCIKGTNESSLVDELKVFENNAYSFEKNSTSTVFIPGFLDRLSTLKELKRIVVTGCCTDICVMNAVIPLINYFDQIDKSIEVIVPTNAVETYDSPSHNRDEYNEMAYKLMRQAGAKILRKYRG